jgi:hypothetical protein
MDLNPDHNPEVALALARWVVEHGAERMWGLSPYENFFTTHPKNPELRIVVWNRGLWLENEEQNAVLARIEDAGVRHRRVLRRAYQVARKTCTEQRLREVETRTKDAAWKAVQELE